MASNPSREPSNLSPIIPFAPAGAGTPTGVPVALTPLVGRETEVADLLALLRDPDIRLVTLTGPGGVGKTRLAIAVAAALGDAFAGRVAFVSLGGITDPRLVAPTVARSLGVPEADDRRLLEGFRTKLGAGEHLLLLDNFEQVLEAAPFVTDLLAACPRLSLLVTSRALLRVSGEHDFVVPPLSLPDRSERRRRPALDELARADAVHLFLARASAVDPELALSDVNVTAIAEICERLDGLPLAIELAAAKSNLLPPSALLARLKERLPLLTGGAWDAPARLRTMRDAIAWSYDLLTETEQRLLRRLAVFAGGFTMEAAATVCGPEADLGCNVLAGLGALLDQSLLRREAADGEPRFTMLETIREYASERLAESGEAEARRQAHGEYFLAVAEQAEAALFGHDQDRWLDRLDAEIPNLRAALGWTAERGPADPAPGLRLACALWLFWLQRSRVGEGCRWFERALAHDRGAPPALRAKALLGLGGLALPRGDLGRASSVGDESLAIYRALGDALGVARSLHLLGVTAQALGETATAVSLLEEAVAGYAAAGDRIWGAVAVGQLGLAAYDRGDRERAASLFDQASASQREVGDAWPPAFPLPTLGPVACDKGDWVVARAWYDARLRRCVDEGDEFGLVEVLTGLACLAGANAEPSRVACLGGAADGLREGVAGPPTPFGRAAFEGAIATARTTMGEAAFAAAWAAGRTLPRSDLLVMAAAARGTLSGTSIAAGRPSGPAAPRLTSREREILRLVAAGATDREVAAALAIALRTVEWHVANVLSKLDLPSRAAAAAYAVRHGLG